MTLKTGHTPGHYRETADAAIETWIRWEGKMPEPTVEFEIGYVSHRIPISRACRLVWNCTDFVPGWLFDQVQAEAQGLMRSSEPVIKKRTYAACARFILAWIKRRRTKAA